MLTRGEPRLPCLPRPGCAVRERGQNREAGYPARTGLVVVNTLERRDGNLPPVGRPGGIVAEAHPHRWSRWSDDEDDTGAVARPERVVAAVAREGQPAAVG